MTLYFTRCQYLYLRSIGVLKVEGKPTTTGMIEILIPDAKLTESGAVPAKVLS
jgi:UDP-N-acetylmuramate-alanine ligase